MTFARYFALVLSVALVHGFGPYPIDKTQISVGGLSSGGFMAVQVHVAYSKTFMGAGIFAGGPYYCAQDSEINAFEQCMYAVESIPVQSLVSQAQSWASEQTIDDPSNLARSRVFLYSGTDDSVVNPSVMHALETFYQSFITNTSQINTQWNIPSQHCIPTNDFGNSCSYLGSPYINNCGYDGAGAALNTIYQGLRNPVQQNTNNIVSFSQGDFLPWDWTLGEASMGETGYAYIPSGCQPRSSNYNCKLHIAYHGCQQTVDDIQNQFYTNAGYNGWAEANNIIIVYPQAIKSDFAPSNPEGCFDWWGYTNSYYAVQSGPQMYYVSSLLKAILPN